MKVSPPLDRRFRLIAFDWEVAARTDDATAVCGPIDRLLRCGVTVVVVTAAPLDAIGSRFSRAISGRQKRNLFLATNRGAEVYGFDEALEPTLVWDDANAEAGGVGRAESPTWFLRGLAERSDIRPEEILVVSDDTESFTREAAPVRDDDPGAAPGGPVFVSVGPGPGGVPGILHLGGEPRLIGELLGAQAALHPVRLPATPEQDAEWVIVEDGFVPTREHEVESLFAIGNGFVGSRGSLAEGSPLSAPATFVAGIFDASPDTMPALARAPDWTHLTASLNGSRVGLDASESLEHRRVLDMRQGILWRLWRHRDRAGRVSHIQGMRLASLADRHLLLQSIAITPENYSEMMTLEIPALGRPEPIRMASGATLDLFAATRIEDPEGKWTPPPLDHERDGASEQWAIELELGRTYRLDRIAGVRTSRESYRTGTARDEVRDAYDDGLAAIVDAHRTAWQTRWDASDIVIDGDADAQRALRFAAYHLISAANPEDEFVSIGARALTGPAYKGHAFWDTEIFMLPFFTLTYPEAARALLMYRYHTLSAARARAKRFGYRGALYAWESADTGEDVTPSMVVAPTGDVIRILVGEEEHHISADVAYGVWSYWHSTADEQFLLRAGAEMLVETARFWASRVERGADGLHHIRRVIGPDEYHESVDDNAYTNGMAQWNLEIAAEVSALVAERWPERWNELSRRVGMESDEPREWRDIAAHMYTGLDPKTGLFEQFHGYFGLERIDLAAYEPRSVPMDVLLGRERTQKSQVIKQADVVMLVYLLWDRFPAWIREANFRYYEPRTGHGSSLSPPIHATVAARLGDVELAQRYLRETAAIDLANRMGNAAGGVHAGTLGGLWQAVAFGFAGLTLPAEGPRLAPSLPDAWRRLRFAIQWRGQRVPIDVSQGPPARGPTAEVSS